MYFRLFRCLRLMWLLRMGTLHPLCSRCGVSGKFILFHGTARKVCPHFVVHSVFSNCFQISIAKTTGSNDRYQRFEWTFVNTTDYLTIIGPSPPRTFTLPPMMCFIVTFIPSSLPAGMGFQLNYAYTEPPSPPPHLPNVVPNDEFGLESSDKVHPFSELLST
jgi:hypothetical protein